MKHLAAALILAASSAGASDLSSVVGVCAEPSASSVAAAGAISAAGLSPFTATGNSELAQAMALSAFPPDIEGLSQPELSAFLTDETTRYADIIAKMEASTEAPFDQMDAAFVRAGDGTLAEMGWLTVGSRVYFSCRIAAPAGTGDVAGMVAGALDDPYLEQSAGPRGPFVMRQAMTDYDDDDAYVWTMTDIPAAGDRVVAIQTLVKIDAP